MLIWLGKQRLGQKDNHDMSVHSDMKIGIVNYGSLSDPKPWKIEEKQTLSINS